jgi:hypothetical protein
MDCLAAMVINPARVFDAPMLALLDQTCGIVKPAIA